MAQSLVAYQEQLAQLETALALAPGDQELIKLRADLIELVSTLADLAKIEQVGKSTSAAGGFCVGEKVLALSGEGWHPARVERVTDKGYDVEFMGTLRGDKELVAKLAVKPYVRPDTSVFAPGQAVRAWYAGDREFYDATVCKVSADAVDVVYAGFDGEHSLEPECVQAGGGGAGPSGSLNAAGDVSGVGKKRPFQIPASLEIKPDDTPEVVERKKKKLHAMKRKQLLVERDEAVEEQRSNWQSFVHTKKDFGKLTKNNHDPLFDPERDHQEMARRFRGPQAQREGL